MIAVCGLLAVLAICWTSLTRLHWQNELEVSGRKHVDTVRLAQHLEVELAEVKALKDKINLLLLKNGLRP